MSGTAEHDLVVIGSSPCGIACAVRAAREGLSVTLVSEGRHVGGMLSSGIGVMDTQYDGRRAPLYDEVLARETDTAPGHLDADLLLRRLVAAPMMVSFFNDFDMATGKPWVPAVQYLGTRGLFADYDARPDDPLSMAVAEVWARACGELLAGPPRGAAADRTALATARAVHRATAAERESGHGAGGRDRGAARIARARFVALLTAAARYRGLELSASQLATAGNRSRTPGGADTGPLTRAEACRMLFAVLDRSGTS